MQVLVLGANGFIGRRLMAALTTAGWAKPIAGVRTAPRVPDAGVEYRILDATDETAVGRAMAGVEAVVNCVAGKADAISESARVLFTAASRTSPMPRVVHLSTMSVYGDATGLIDERAPLRGDLGAYAAAKVAAERYAAGYSRSVILRPGCVYGPGSPQWSVRIAEFLMARRLGDLGADGDGCCNLVHVDDVVSAVTKSLQLQPSAGIFNLSAPVPPTWNEFLMRYGRALKAVPIRRISHRRLVLETKLLAPPLKVLEIALRIAKLGRVHIPPPLPPSLLGLMRQDIRLSVALAERVLGVRWTPLDAGIDATARWYLAEKFGHGNAGAGA
jgi:nucleoside-diphosphate-sugar epimerase